MRPQVGVGGGTPMPRKLRPASRRIVPEVLSAAITMSVGATFGSTWRSEDAAVAGPHARARRRTKSRSRSDSVSLRTTRATPVQLTRPITTKIVHTLGRSTATSATASSRPGNASMTSVQRIRTTSTAPPK